MTGLPKAIIKKYGVTKKAWSVYRSGSTRSRTTNKTRSVQTMARHRKSRSRSSGLGGGKMMNGLWQPQGMIKGAILGLGAALIVNSLPIDVPYKQEIASFAVGGVPGVAAVYLTRAMTGSTTAAASSGVVYH